VYSAKAENLDTLRVDSTILLKEDSHGIENSAAESVDWELLVSEKSQCSWAT